MAFLRYYPWSDYTLWKKSVTIPYKNSETRGVQTLRAALSPIILRRTKTMLGTTGNELVTLPGRIMHTERVQLSPAEKQFYDQLFYRSQEKFDSLVSSGTALRKYTTILTLLLRLRQACDHPMLAQSESADENGSSENEDDVNKALISKLYKKFLEEAVKEGQISPVSLSLSKVSANENEKKRSIADSSAAKLLPVHVQSVLSHIRHSGIQDYECPVCLDTPGDPIISLCAHIFCSTCFSQWIGRYAGKPCPVCHKHVKSSEVIRLSKGSTDGHKRLEVSANNKNLSDWKASSKLCRMVEQLKVVKSFNRKWSCENGKAKRVCPTGDHEGMVAASSEDTTSDETLEDLRVQVLDYVGLTPESAVKVVVFSQWTKMLDLIQQALEENDIDVVRLDGKMNQKKRGQSLKRFRESDNVDVILISLKAGGVGLNLTEGSLVYLVDPWWNPAVEDQAINRVHRIGQKNTVLIKRMICSDTIEERLLKLQEKKEHLAKDALSAANPDDHSANSLQLEDFMLLFGRG